MSAISSETSLSDMYQAFFYKRQVLLPDASPGNHVYLTIKQIFQLMRHPYVIKSVYAFIKIHQDVNITVFTSVPPAVGTKNPQLRKCVSALQFRLFQP